MHQVILWLAGIGAVLGGADHLLGDRFGLGKKFREGFDMMGPLALSMTGVIVIAPVLAGWLQPLLAPVFRLAGADPAMFASLIANDMGGYPLAMSLAEKPEMGVLSGCIIASMLGCTLTYSIPLGFGLVKEQTHQANFVQGLLVGLTTIPVGGVLGGLAAGFRPADVLINNVPVLAVSLALALGFRRKPIFVRRLVVGFCQGIRGLGLLGIVIGAFTKLTGVPVPLMDKADSLMNALTVVGEITVVLIGILPMLELLLRLVKKPMNRLSRVLGINGTAARGLVYTMANPLPVFGMFGEMDPRGRILNSAWLVTASAALGDHLGFTSGVAPEMVVPMLAGRFAAAICSLLLAMAWTRGSQKP